MLEDLTMIEATVRAMVTMIDDLGGTGGDGGGDPG